MPLDFGSATTSAFHVGTANVSAIYQGTTQVWPTTSAGISYVATGGLVETSGTTTATPYPTGLAAGDFLLAALGTTLATHTDPAGWTLVHSNAGTDFRFSCWYKLATGSESGNLAITAGAASSSYILAYRGVNQTTPQDATVTTVATTTAATTIVLPAQTAATIGAVPVWVGSGANGGRTFTSAGTERIDAGTTQKSMFAYDDAAVTSTGSTGTRTVTISANNRMVAAMLLLRPA